MRLPWFMHMHRGTNTLTGVLPTPIGTFVRSNADGRMEVAWYPMDTAFPGGGSRECKRLATVDSSDEGEIELERAVVDFMHGHPVLALQCSWEDRAGAPLHWTFVSGGVLGTHETERGLFYRIEHGRTITLEFLPSEGHGRRETLGVLADSCDEDTLAKRVDALVRRRLDKADRVDRQRAVDRAA